MSSYRIIVTYSEEKKSFVARAPELEACEAEAETRAEAVARLEEELEAQVENMKEQGIDPPVPLDLEAFDGQLSVKVSPELHRDLVFLARLARVELEELLVELLARGTAGPGPRSGGQQRRPRQDGGRRREGQGDRYHDIMENRADFIEYVRRMEGGGGGGRGGRGGRRGGRK